MPPVNRKKKWIDDPAHRAAAREATKEAGAGKPDIKEAESITITKAEVEAVAERLRRAEAAEQFMREAAANLRPTITEPSPFVPRYVKWLWLHKSGMFGVMRITHGRESWEYFVEKFGKDTFILRKLVPLWSVTYNVGIGTTKFCGCRRGQKGVMCKHIQALESLRAMGKL